MTNRLVLTLLALSLMMPFARAADISPLIARIRAVGREGSGNAEAAQAWRELAQSDASALPAILAGFDNADARAVNWLRGAVDAIAERELAAGKKLPAEELEAFIKQSQHHGSARRLAYEWLVRVDPKAPDRLLPDMLQDPNVELRRDAVARVIKDADRALAAGNKADAEAAFRKALAGARDRDQVDAVAKQLKTLGVSVDLAAHFGFIKSWQLAGPFDHVGGVGWTKDYPPEHGVDLTATYPGKKDAVKWLAHTTGDAYGTVDLNKAIGKNMGAVAYAFAAVVSPTERPVEIRVGTTNAVKIFLNGKLLFAREEYHHGMKMDQHVGFGTLKAGRNEILIKICQNEQTDTWAQNWSFQCRLCDAVGSPVPFVVANETTTGGK
jgi:hypothetical protein